MKLCPQIGLKNILGNLSKYGNSSVGYAEFYVQQLLIHL